METVLENASPLAPVMSRDSRLLVIIEQMRRLETRRELDVFFESPLHALYESAADLEGRYRGDENGRLIIEQLLKLNALEEEEPHSSFHYNRNEMVRSFSHRKTVLCRICEAHIPAHEIEQHLEECAGSFTVENKSMEVDSRLVEVEKQLQSMYSHLKVKDLRPSNAHVPEVMSTVSNIIEVEPSTESAFHTLSWLTTKLAGIKVSEERAEQLREEAHKLAKDKLKLVASLNQSKTIKLKSKTQTLPSLAPVSIADFHIISRISSGAYSRVFLARKMSTQDVFAIKVLSRSLVERKLEQILTERDILAMLIHPYAVTFYYSFVGENNLYFVMEFISGGDLSSLLENVGSLDEEAARFYGMQLVIILEFLREKEIIHRDIKCDNLLIGENGSLKIADFGLSLFKNSNICNLGGSLDYMSPEVLKEEEYSFSTDYWSLGVVLYEMVTGTPPFHQDTEFLTREAILAIDYDTEGLSEELCDLLAHLFVEEPTRRLGHKSLEDIKRHPWFAGIDWNDPDQYAPPFIPILNSKEDISYFVQRRSTFNSDDSDIRADIFAATNAPKLMFAQKKRRHSFVQSKRLPNIGLSRVGIRQLQSLSTSATTTHPPHSVIRRPKAKLI